MRNTTLLASIALSLVAAAATPGPAQVGEGDLLIAVARMNPNLGGDLLRLNPRTGIVNTLSVARAPFHQVEMADDNFHALVNTTSAILMVNLLTGSRAAVAYPPGFHFLHGLDREGDGDWLITGVEYMGGGYDVLWSYRMGRYTTLFTTRTANNMFGDVLIDRDPGAPTYLIAMPQRLSWPAKLLGASRTGIVNTIVTGVGCTGIDIDPASGDYLATDGRVSLVSKAGQVRYLTADIGAVGGRFAADGTAWIVSSGTVRRMDTMGRVIATFSVPNHTVGIEVAGRRRMLCTGSGAPGTSVKVSVQSRKSGDGGKAYQLACSLARRPGVRFANGEWLSLDVADEFFRMSLLGLAPSIFQGFRGTLDNQGDATAQVNIPSTVPPNLGITMFVAGVIYDSTGIRTVTNTHWFVLN